MTRPLAPRPSRSAAAVRRFRGGPRQPADVLATSLTTTGGEPDKCLRGGEAIGSILA